MKTWATLALRRLEQGLSLSFEVLARRRRSLAVLLPVLLGMLIGAGILAYISAGEIYDYQDTVDGVHLPEVDVIVCLAGGRGRISAAGDIWYRYWELSQTPLPGAGRSPTPRHPPILYLSGMGHHANWNVLAKQMRRGVLEVLKPENVVIEKESENTDANARWFGKYAQQKGWENILLITSRYHMRRSRLIFDRVLNVLKQPVRIETLSVYQEPFEPGEWRSGIHGVRVTLTEYFKWLYYKSFWTPKEGSEVILSH